MEIKVQISEYLDHDEIKNAATYAARQYFADELRRDNTPYRILYEAVKQEGFEFRETILEKIQLLREEESTYFLTSSDEFKKQMGSILKEHRDLLVAAVVRKIETMDEYDLQKYIGECVVEALKGAK